MRLQLTSARSWGRFAPIAVAVFATSIAPAAPGFRTVIGGAGQDYAAAVTSDAAGNTYVAGLAYSPDLPVTPGVVQTKFGGTCDAFVTKLGPDGKVVWTTYLGGILDDAATGIAVDSAGNVIVSGYTRSADFPLVHPIQSTLNLGASGGIFDGFVAKIDPTGTKLLYSTFIGSRNHDFINGLAMDAAGNAYVTGTTQDAAGFTGLPASATGFGSFVCKLDPQGALVYSFFHPGGSGVAIALDPGGNAYVTGSTVQSAIPSGTQAALVYKLSADGSRVLYEKTIGGSASVDGLAIAVDHTGAAYIGGTTSSIDFPLVKPLQTSLGARPLWKSTDGGHTWIPFDNLPFAFPQALVSDPSTPNTLYAATSDLGMFKSTDGGTNWTRINRGIAENNVKVLAIDPQHPQTLYAGTGSSPGVVYKTVDGGTNWSKVDSTSGPIGQVLIDAQNPNNVYYVSSNNSSHKSTDGGATWANIPFPGTAIVYLAVDPGVSGNLFAFSPFIFGGFFGGATSISPFIWHSTNGGAAWTMIPSPPTPATGSGMLIDASVKPSIVYNGVSSRSLDNGAMWQNLPVSPVSSDGAALAVDAAGTLYGVGTNGIYASQDHGQSWTLLGAPASPLNSGAVTTNISSIVPTANPSTLFTIVRNTQNSGFVAKLTPAGSNIAFSTYLNGHISFVPVRMVIAEPVGLTQQNVVSALTLDPAGNLIVAGQTRANDFPVAGTAPSKPAGLGDAFISAISADGSKMLYSTYLGGSQDDGALAVGSDAQGNVIVAGQTWSPDFPGGVQPPAGQLGDAFVVKIVPPGPPVITAVLNGASFQPGIEAGSWVVIKGTNLANTNPGRIWKDSEVVDGQLPTSLDGVSVTINGKPAFVYYISPTQINLQAPSDSTIGPVDVVVTNNGLASPPATAQLQAAAPAFFTYFGTGVAIASRLPDYAPVGGPASSGTPPVKPGDLLVLWGTGFGATNPAAPAGQAVEGAPVDVTTPIVTVGGVTTPVISAGLTTGTAGLYQITIQVPGGLAAGAQTVQASVGGVKTPDGVTIVVANP
jgi:uncharacterized protein (TIGR03437 family)